MLGMMRNWIYERDPVDALRFEQPLADLKKELSKDANAYFAKLLKEQGCARRDNFWCRVQKSFSRAGVGY